MNINKLLLAIDAINQGLIPEDRVQGLLDAAIKPDKIKSINVNKIKNKKNKGNQNAN